MGVIHRVHHLQWKIDLAVKTPNEVALARAGGRKRFQEREAYEWVRLGPHPNIASCPYVRALDDGLPHIFIEYVDGGSLANWLGQGKVVDLAMALDIGIQICWGLGWAHKCGLVHRDINPRNILMTVDGTPKVTDFGLVKPLSEVTEETREEGPTGVTTARGTIDYSAPEQWIPGVPITAAADVYAVGVVLYELLQRPLELPTFPNAQPGARPALYRSELKKREDVLAKVLLRCMAHKPDERYPTDAATLAEELQAIYTEVIGQVYPRRMPDESRVLSDGLNNQALSLLDLGKQEEAEPLWEQALQADPHHPHATFNRGLYLWRKGRVTDDELVRQLEAVRTTHGGDWVDEYLLGLVHLERGDTDAARTVLEDAARTAPGDGEVAAALETSSAQGGWGHCLRIFEGHTHPIRSVALTPDGRFAVSGSDDQTLRIWEVSTGRCLRTCVGYTSSVASVCLTADGRWAISAAAWDNTLWLWEASTGRRLRTFEGHMGTVLSVALTLDGRFALSGSMDNTLRLWEVATGRCVRILEGHQRYVESVALTPDGRFALSGSHDKTIRLWELATGQCLRVFEGHTDMVSSVALTLDGRFALSGSEDQTIRLWEMATGQCLHTLRGQIGSVNSVAFTPDGRFALSGSDDNTLRLWELATGQCVRTLTGHTNWVRSVALTADGCFALSGSNDNTLRLWELGSLQNRCCPWSYAHPRPVTVLIQEAEKVQLALAKVRDLLAQGKFQAAASELRKARDVEGYERYPELLESWRQIGQGGWRSALLGAWHTHTFEGHTDWVTAVALSADGRLAVSGGYDKTLRLWEMATGRCIRTFDSYIGNVTSVTLTLDGRFVLSGSSYKALRLWDLTTEDFGRTFEGHTGPGWLTSVALTSDGRFALSGSEDQTLRLWELATGRCLRASKSQTGYVRSIALTPDDRFVLTGNSDKTLQLWELATGHCLRTFQGHTAPVTSVALTPNGCFALSGSEDQTLRLWELATGHCLRTFQGHTALVTSVALTADGYFALSGSADKTLRLWELATGQSLHTLTDHTDWVTSVALTGDSRFALSGSNDGTLRLWELDWDYEFQALADWDEDARLYLETFLILHTPYAAPLPQDREPSEEELALALTHRGKISWTEEDFQSLIQQLRYAGYGWLRPEGVRRVLEELVSLVVSPLSRGVNTPTHGMGRMTARQKMIDTRKTNTSAALDSAMPGQAPSTLPRPSASEGKVSWLSKLFGRGKRK